MNGAASREVRAGLVVALGLIGLLALLALAGGGPGFLTSRQTIDVIFRDGQGIRVGSPVRVAGIDAGRVVGIDLVEEKDNGGLRARVRISVPSDLAARADFPSTAIGTSPVSKQSPMASVSSCRASDSTGNGRCSRSASSRWYAVSWVERPNTSTPRSASSAWWSRKPHDSGVQPRAPGMLSHSSTSNGSPGTPVRG